MSPAPSIRASVAKIIGWEPDSWRSVQGGYTAAARFVIQSADRSAFAKVATSPLTARLLRREIAAYRKLSGSFLPTLYGYDDNEHQPLLIIEDLSAATWPPPWTPQAVDLVLEQIAAVHRTEADFDGFTAVHGNWTSGWETVAADPTHFLALGLASPDWLRHALPALLDAERACEVSGDTLCHLDLRSDNLCVAPHGVKLIDWAEACLSNPLLDLGAWLPSLHHEGGPPPEDILPVAPEIAAWVAGFFAARAGLPIIPDAPAVRRVQREQLSTALPWAQRALGLAALR